MTSSIASYDIEGAVKYHYGEFPPRELDYSRLLTPLTDATDALARYDSGLLDIHNPEILIRPLRDQEAIASSRMEGTVTTLDELMQAEAELTENPAGKMRQETREVYLYSRAIRDAQIAMTDGYGLSETLIRQAHKTLLGFGRGAAMSPGNYKTEQNYIADNVHRKITFIPISPEHLNPAMQALMSYLANSPLPALITIAIAHLEFEALHPFKDGNGRVGRMLATLSMWDQRLISQPNFYLSGYLDEEKDQYIAHMQAVSRDGDWTGWVAFFLTAVAEQARRNLNTINDIKQLYEDMKPVFREALSSKWALEAQDFVFTNPFFQNSALKHRSGIPASTAGRFARPLLDRGLLTEYIPAAGRRSAYYRFDPLMNVVRGR